jgi:hypothetical protein
MTKFEKAKNALSKFTKLKPDFTMMNEKVKNALSKVIKLKPDFTMTKLKKIKNVVTRFLSRQDVIVFLMLAIVWTCLFCFVIPIADNLADMKNKPIKVTCSDEKINYPMVYRSARSQIEMFAHVTCQIFASMLLTFIWIIQRRSENKSIIRYFFKFLLWILSLITGSVFVWLWVDNGPTETLAPNFLAACKPQGLDLLCSPDSHLEDWNPVVWVTCTTPPDMWIPALSNSLPPLAAVQAFLMFAAVLQMIYYCQWKELVQRVVSVCKLFHLAVCMFVIGLIVSNLISDNVSNFNKEFVSSYLKCFAVACVWLAVDRFWQTTKIEPKLPRYWNDPTPQGGRFATTLTPPLHEPPATTGSTTREKQNVYRTIYPNLPPKYEYPPSYGDLVFRY